VDEALADEPYLYTSRYHRRLRAFLDAGYDLARVCVVEAEALASRQGETLDRLCRFLGVDPAPLAGLPRIAHHVTERKRELTEAGLRLRGRLKPLRRRVPWALRSHVEGVLLRPWTVPLAAKRPSAETVARLRALLEEDAERFAALTGHDPAGWRSAGAPSDPTGSGLAL
jgi:hypothetical protein